MRIFPVLQERKGDSHKSDLLGFCWNARVTSFEGRGKVDFDYCFYASVEA
jgi:hypothetical protein